MRSGRLSEMSAIFKRVGLKPQPVSSFEFLLQLRINHQTKVHQE